MCVCVCITVCVYGLHHYLILKLKVSLVNDHVSVMQKKVQDPDFSTEKVCGVGGGG